MPEKKTPLDVLGVAPVARSIERVAAGAVSGASAFLSRICLPAAEEFGLMLRDQVGAWRQNNAVAIAAKAERLLGEAEGHRAPPRLVFAAMEHGSWIDDDRVQDMWAGLLASSCTEEGDDDSNLPFVDLLSQLTMVEARILNYACAKAEKAVNSVGLIHCKTSLNVSLEELLSAAGIADLHRLDMELDHLRSLELIDNGIDLHNPDPADVTPTAIALNLYARAAGFRGPVSQFYGVKQ